MSHRSWIQVLSQRRVQQHLHLLHQMRKSGCSTVSFPDPPGGKREGVVLTMIRQRPFSQLAQGQKCQQRVTRRQVRNDWKVFGKLYIYIYGQTTFST